MLEIKLRDRKLTKMGILGTGLTALFVTDLPNTQKQFLNTFGSNPQSQSETTKNKISDTRKALIENGGLKDTHSRQLTFLPVVDIIIKIDIKSITASHFEQKRPTCLYEFNNLGNNRIVLIYKRSYPW